MFAVLVLVAVIGFLLLKDGRVGPLSWDGPRCRRPDHAERLLAEQSLIHSGVVVYAAIAGICLFVAGLISGYFDNYAAYNRIPQRIRQLAWARRLLGEYRLQRVANYVGDNLGALAGKVWRIGLMGHSSRPANVALCLAALEAVIRG